MPLPWSSLSNDSEAAGASLCHGLVEVCSLHCAALRFILLPCLHTACLLRTAILAGAPCVASLTSASDVLQTLLLLAQPTAQAASRQHDKPLSAVALRELSAACDVLLSRPQATPAAKPDESSRVVHQHWPPSISSLFQPTLRVGAYQSQHQHQQQQQGTATSDAGSSVLVLPQDRPQHGDR